MRAKFLRRWCVMWVWAAFTATLPVQVRADITTTELGPPGPTARDLVLELLGPGVVSSNETFTGALPAGGIFSGGTGIIGFERGVILSSGRISTITGPNDSESTTTSWGTPGDPDLQSQIPGYATFDAALLEFDLIPEGAEITFQYVFASEEYNEYANSPFNNVFGFFVNGVNYALLPDGVTPVSINNVNGGNPLGVDPHNPVYYINNSCFDGGCFLNTEADGQTVVLSITAPVLANQVNHIKLAIADAGDSVLDSWVFIRSESITPPESCPDVPPVTCTETEPCDVLEGDDHCPDGVTINEDVVLAEPSDGALCGGEALLVLHRRRGNYTVTRDSTSEVCDTQCHGDCYESCTTLPIQQCYQECVRRCTNGVCLQWETRCNVVGQQDFCNQDCHLQCKLNFDEVTQTSFFNRQCGHQIEDTFEIRQVAGTCSGAVVETANANGWGSAGMEIPVPLQPGSYQLCLGGQVVKSFNVEDCGPACRLTLAQNTLDLTTGIDGQLPVEIENVSAGGTYTLSLHRYQDNEHTISMSLPPFLLVPGVVDVAVGGSQGFSLSATNPQPDNGQDHWVNVILRAEGPATCEVPFDVNVLVPPCLPPVAVATQTTSSDCTAPGEKTVTLDGSGSFDPLGQQVVSYEWQDNSTPLGAGAVLEVPLPLGSHTLTLTVMNACGLSGSTDLTVPVQDTTSPTIIGMSVDPSVLWPPNHKLRDVTANYTATDLCSPVTCSLSVTSNEPVNGTGDGDTSPDWVVLDDHHLQLRAERAGTGNGRTYTAMLSCADASGNVTPAPSSAAVIVKHDMSSPKSGSAFRIGSSVSFAGSFWDVPARTHTAQWLFDSLTSTGTVTEPTTTKPGSVKGGYTFTSTGVYAVKMNVKDGSGATGTADAVGGVNALVVIYDPNGGYVTGGGWLDSPTGALVGNPGLTGKVNFGLVSKYFKNATNPKGETEFDFRLAGFKFNALNFDYLMISGAKAMYKGLGKVNGGAGYNFILTVIDGQATGGGGVDKFRMKIWNKSTGAITYDNQMGAPDNADPTTPVGAGSNVVIQP